MKRESINIKNLQQDEVYVKSEVVSLSAITGYPVRKGLEKVIISEGTIVNTVSDQYGHLPNERFFFEVEQKLVEGDIQYLTRSINRDIDPQKEKRRSENKMIIAWLVLIAIVGFYFLFLITQLKK